MVFAVAFILQLLDILEQMRARPDAVAESVELEIQEGPSTDTPPVAPAVSLPPVAEPEPPRPETLAKREAVPPRLRPPRVLPREPEPPPHRLPAKRERRPEHRILQAVDQPHESDEPTPDDPHFLSQSNRNVEEETVARARSLTQNDPNPQGARPNPSPDEETGTDAEEAARESRDREGARESDTATASAEANPPPETPSQLGGDARPRADAVAAVPEVPRVERAGIETRGPGEVSVPTPGERAGQEGRAGRRRGRGPGRGPDLRLSWTQFHELYGEGELRRQREEVAELRRTRIRGSSSGNWERIRAAIENYVPDVRPGNQTALRSAASPFAVYLAQVHRRLHRLWAEGVLVDFAMRSDDSPLNDISLIVNLEIVINPDGSIAKVGVLEGGSGSLPYDAAAVDVVYRSAPHPNPPREIRSGDGRTYLHWAFYRNQRQCGTFNAEPYILPVPPSMPRDSGEPDEPETPPPSPPPTAPPPRDAPSVPADGTVG
jgi:TonB family protein